MAGDEDVKELIKKRGSYKGRLTTFINYCTELGKKDILVSTDAKELQLRIGKLESLYEHYDQVQLQLECLVDDVQIQYASRSEFESQYYQALATAQDILNKYNKYTVEHDSNDKSTRASAHHQLVKLPTIQLPKFNGMYDKWLEFRDTFTSLIHSNNDIDEINKFHYLRASLDGSASVVIQSIDFSASNYSIAWKLLCDRFDNKHLLIQNHISALFGLETITKESSTILKRLINQLNKNIRALESLGEPVQQWDTLLIYIVTQKLDQKTYREWEEFKGRVDKEDTVTFDMFINFMRKRAELIETLELSRNNHSITYKHNSKFKSMVSVQNNSSVESLNKNLCPKCKGDHILSNCSHFLALSNEARLKLLPSYKLCFNCFRSGHFANRCKKQGCKICKRRHNTLVHLDDLKCNDMRKEESFLPNVSSSSAQPSTLSSGSYNNNLALSVNISSCDIRRHEDVLLSTALIKLYDTNNHEHIVRAVLDSGSTSCLITERLSQRLNILITSNLPNSEIDIRYLKIPSNICLADPIFYKPGEVDILLGADIFWDLIGSSNLKLGDKKPVLFETKLGWVISGRITSHRHASFLGNDIRCNLTNVSDTHAKIENDKFDLTRFWQLDEVNPHSFQYSPEEKLCEEHFVKNTFRLDDGRLWDRVPLGLLAPAVIVMKILLQSLWLRKLSWDEPVSPDIYKQWKTVLVSLPLLNKIKVPRMVVCDSYQALELHVFSDASERAYGACVYVRTINSNGDVVVRLLAAKSRVAPIKPTTIPRLELCGALVGTRLCEKVLDSFRCKIHIVSFWTDSTIVLSWLRILPSRLQPFVRNHVAEILERAGNCRWLHVPTKQNPADLISRGLDISSLQMSDLWWTGPAYLKQVPIRLPSQPKYLENLPETKSDISLSAMMDSSNCDISFIDFSRFSNYIRLLRSIAYVLRFVNFCKGQSRVTHFLTEVELRTALKVIIKTSQNESFPEYKLILENKNLPKKSPLVKFNVFLDDDNIMRVGGRLDHSDFSHDKKHPILLQSTHIFTKLLFESEHRRLLHAGPQLLLATIRETYWPIGGRNLAKACYHKCVRCSRMKGEVVTPMMGNLPRHRLVSGGFPFENIGLDYAGPIMSASRQGRGCRLVKVYIAIFVCFATKAIHLELVGDLTSKCFLLALRRFISRRGKPHNIYSDNGKSFVGAFNDISNFLKSNCNSLGESLANEGISFHFIPPYTPHFGGLWEAGMKSTKFHLMRVLGNCNLTYEELSTLLTQIEAILNSRPLTPLSCDPADCTPLTPGHFMIGRPLSCLPQPDYETHSTNYLSRFHRIEQLRQHFWSRWNKEYIAELQQRAKWRVGKSDLKLDTLVVVKEDHLPPLKWRLGRITALYPGPDGIVRVADIRTSSGVIRRAFSKICPLPVSSDSC